MHDIPKFNGFETQFITLPPIEFITLPPIEFNIVNIKDSVLSFVVALLELQPLVEVVAALWVRCSLELYGVRCPQQH